MAQEYIVIIGQVFGILTTICAFVTNQLPKRWQIMLGRVVANALSAINVLLIGAGLTVCAVNLVAVIHSLLNTYRSRRGLKAPLYEKLIFSVLYLAAWGFGFYLSAKNGRASWLDVLPLVATVFFIVSMLILNEQHIRLCTFCNSSIYIVYHTIYRNIGVLAQVFSIISVSIALYRYRDKDKKSRRPDRA
jgi:hypothetical protein